MTRFHLLSCCLLLILLPAHAGGGDETPATLGVGGYGLLGNRDLHKVLRLLDTGQKRLAYFDANYVEDGAQLIFAKLRDDGYLKPTLTVQLTLTDGRRTQYSWTPAADMSLPRPLCVKQLVYRIQRGRLYYFETITFSGLHVIPESDALPFFYPTDSLIQLRRNRVFNPSGLTRSLQSLRETLDSKGHSQATVSAGRVDMNDVTGAVRLVVDVQEGPVMKVKTVHVTVVATDGTENTTMEPVAPGTLYSSYWRQNLLQTLRARYYHEGYPDVKTSLVTTHEHSIGRETELELAARVETGPRIRISEVTFAGRQRTHEHVLRNRVDVRAGEWLNPLVVDEGRYRLAQLGIFDSVFTQYEPTGDDTRRVTYEVKEGDKFDVNLMLGYGSYELLRGGIEWNQYNIWGLAHSFRLQFIQSMKSTSSEARYNIPEILGEDLNLFGSIGTLRREELTFIREEYSSSLGVQRLFPATDINLSVRYAHELLKARQVVQTQTASDTESRVGAVILDARQDRRNNPLSPKTGHTVLTTVEVASEFLGGESEYQRFVLSGSWHREFRGGRVVHLGFTHGAVCTWGGDASSLPFNKRFFPGGENSVRGYQLGEAAPRNDAGEIVGAEAYLQGNLELEQYLTPSWSLVGFVDAVGFARSIGDYPANEALVSIGGGVRFQTIIGPIRLEYGHNLNPREFDPSGTLHLSIGFPF